MRQVIHIWDSLFYWKPIGGISRFFRGYIVIEEHDVLILRSGKESAMTQPHIRNDLLTAAAGPLLPVEMKLVGWGFGAGLALLAVLLLVHG